MADADLLTDAETLLIQQGVAMGIVERVIAELRHRYGGDRPYIHRLERQRRNEAIAADAVTPIILAGLWGAAARLAGFLRVSGSSNFP
jgi:hypothetical protein